MTEPEKEIQFPQYHPPGIPVADRAFQKPLTKLLKARLKHPRLRSPTKTAKWKKKHRFY